jgi:hypothetical protein
MIEKPLHRYSPIDSGALARLFRSDDVYIPSADDHTNPAEVMNFIDNALASPVIYALGRDPRIEAFIFGPSHNATTFQGHFAVRKDHRGPEIVKKTAEAGKWVFENTRCRSIIAFVREDNRVAQMALGQVGMTRKGVIEKSVFFNGEYINEIIYQCTVDDYNEKWGSLLGRVQ